MIRAPVKGVDNLTHNQKGQVVSGETKMTKVRFVVDEDHPLGRVLGPDGRELKLGISRAAIDLSAGDAPSALLELNLFELDTLARARLVLPIGTELVEIAAIETADGRRLGKEDLIGGGGSV